MNAIHKEDLKQEVFDLYDDYVGIIFHTFFVKDSLQTQ